MTLRTPDAARKMPCPIARTFADGFGAKCRGDGCMVWRWHPPMTTDPGYAEAVQKAVADGVKPAQAARHVQDNRAAYGLPEGPWRGYCGLGGEVRA